MLALTQATLQELLSMPLGVTNTGPLHTVSTANKAKTSNTLQNLQPPPTVTPKLQDPKLYLKVTALPLIAPSLSMPFMAPDRV